MTDQRAAAAEPNRLSDLVVDDSLDTPAFVYDQTALTDAVYRIQGVAQESGCKLLYALKACSAGSVVEQLTGLVDGIAASSLYEARLARDAIGSAGTVHFTSPGLRADEVEDISGLCDYVAFNSLSQWARFGAEFGAHTSCGLRVNPQLSFIEDQRYDPCRPASKLGVPLQRLRSLAVQDIRQLAGISGLHVHANCDSTDLSQLAATVRLLGDELSPLLDRCSWVNLGGGYLFDEATGIDIFIDAVRDLQRKYGVEVFIEPGAALVRKAGFLVASVIDLFESDGVNVAVLDTTVAHWPEVFEFAFQPDVVGQVTDGRWRYVLAGCSCLAGDVFGEYAFDEPIAIGSRIIFLEAGAYSVVKSSFFNGLNLPTTYVLSESGELLMTNRSTYDDFLTRCGVARSVVV